MNDAIILIHYTSWQVTADASTMGTRFASWDETEKNLPQPLLGKEGSQKATEALWKRHWLPGLMS